MNASAAPARPWPTELRLKAGGEILEASFDDGVRFALPAAYLRAMTPSAAERGHGPGPVTPLPGKEGVRLTDLRPIGGYAVRLVFDDGHDTGLYTWDLLYDLGRKLAG